MKERGYDAHGNSCSDSTLFDVPAGVDVAEKEQRRMEQCFATIRRDAGAAFPDLKLFAPGAPLRGSLIDLLDAYTMYRSDIGYVRGMHVSFLLSLFPPDAKQ